MERKKARMKAAVLVSTAKGRGCPTEIVTHFGIDAVDHDEFLFTLWEEMEHHFDQSAALLFPRDASSSSPATLWFNVEITQVGGGHGQK